MKRQAASFVKSVKNSTKGSTLPKTVIAPTSPVAKYHTGASVLIPMTEDKKVAYDEDHPYNTGYSSDSSGERR